MKNIAACALALLLVLPGCTPKPPSEAPPVPSDVLPSVSDGEPAVLLPSPALSPSPSPPSEALEDGLEQAFQKGYLVFRDGSALNYQPWLELEKNLALSAAELWVYEPDEDGALYHIEQTSSGVVYWESKTDRSWSGKKLVASVDAQSGEHKLELDGNLLLSFVYDRPDPAAIAQEWGRMPLAQLPNFYNPEQALLDGCLVVLDGAAENAGMLVSFSETLSFDEGSFLRVYQTTLEGDPVLTDLYVKGGRACVSVDSSRDETAGDSRLQLAVYDDCGVSLAQQGTVWSLILNNKQSHEDVVLLKISG